MAGDDMGGETPGLTPEQLQRLAEADALVVERQRRRQKIVRHDAQGREIHEPDALFAAILWVFAEAHRDGATEEPPGRAMWDAHLRVEDEDVLNGHLAGLLAYAITRGRGDPEAVAAAHALLTGPADNPTLAKVRRAVEQVASYDLTVTQFDKKMKRIIPVKRPDLPVVGADAVPLGQAIGILETKLREANLTLDARPTLGEVWAPFLAFAKQPFSAGKGLYVDNDMCFAQWGVGGTFFDLVRQWSMNDAADGSYDHMEQLHVTLTYDPDPVLEEGAADSRWSGDDVSGWAAEVEAAQPFGLLKAKLPTQIRVDHHEV
jgi:hypothetical protein